MLTTIGRGTSFLRPLIEGMVHAREGDAEAGLLKGPLRFSEAAPLRFQSNPSHRMVILVILELHLVIQSFQWSLVWSLMPTWVLVRCRS